MGDPVCCENDLIFCFGLRKRMEVGRGSLLFFAGARVVDQVVFPSPSSGKLALGENDGDQDFQPNNNPHPSS